MLGALFLFVAVVSGLAGYGIALVTAEPLLAAMQERQRVAHEARLAQLRLHQVTQTAMRRLLDEARQ